MKLAVFDIDGTLIPLETHQLDPKTAEALRTLKGNGVVTAVSTGRQYATLQEEIRDLGFDYYLCANGSCIHDEKGNVLIRQQIPADTVRNLTDDFIRLGNPLMFRYEEGGADVNPDIGVGYYSRIFWKPDEKKEYRMARASVKEGELPFGALCHLEADQLQEMTEKYPDLNFTVTGGGATCDITLCGIDKGYALRTLAEYLDIEINETIAFGDDGNDLQLLEAAGIGVAMANASETVREKADYVADTCLNLGVVKALMHFGMIPEEETV